MDFTAGLLLGLLVAALVGVALTLSRRRGPSVAVGRGGLEGLRRVGELVVLRANWSIPATGEDHIFGEVGRRFLRWLWSENRTIMIFRFEIRFRYNLSDPQSVELTRLNPDVLEVKLGSPTHEIALADIRFYHTVQGKLLDWLLPRVVNVFSSDMDDRSRQAILEAAQVNAREEAQQLAKQLEGDARLSAEATLIALGRSAGFSEVRFRSE